MVCPAMPSSDRIRLNVGGTIFETTRATIEPSEMLTAMIDRWQGDGDDDACPFIDRCPKKFTHVLNYLRGYEISENYLHELDFYGIPLPEMTFVPEVSFADHMECYENAGRHGGHMAIIALQGMRTSSGGNIGQRPKMHHHPLYILNSIPERVDHDTYLKPVYNDSLRGYECVVPRYTDVINRFLIVFATPCKVTKIQLKILSGVIYEYINPKSKYDGLEYDFPLLCLPKQEYVISAHIPVNMTLLITCNNPENSDHCLVRITGSLLPVGTIDKLMAECKYFTLKNVYRITLEDGIFHVGESLERYGIRQSVLTREIVQIKVKAYKNDVRISNPLFIVICHNDLCTHCHNVNEILIYLPAMREKDSNIRFINCDKVEIVLIGGRPVASQQGMTVPVFA